MKVHKPPRIQIHFLVKSLYPIILNDLKEEVIIS